MYVCMYLYIYIHICTTTRVSLLSESYRRRRSSMPRYMYICICMYVCMYVHVYVCMYVCMYLYIYIYLCMYLYLYLYLYMYLYLSLSLSIYLSIYPSYTNFEVTMPRSPARSRLCPQSSRPPLRRRQARKWRALSSLPSLPTPKKKIPFFSSNLMRLMWRVGLVYFSGSYTLISYILLAWSCSVYLREISLSFLFSPSYIGWKLRWAWFNMWSSFFSSSSWDS